MALKDMKGRRRRACSEESMPGRKTPGSISEDLRGNDEGGGLNQYGPTTGAGLWSPGEPHGRLLLRRSPQTVIPLKGTPEPSALDPPYEKRGPGFGAALFFCCWCRLAGSLSLACSSRASCLTASRTMSGVGGAPDEGDLDRVGLCRVRASAQRGWAWFGCRRPGPEPTPSRCR